MIDLIWRSELQKSDYFCNQSITIALNQSFLTLYIIVVNVLGMRISLWD